MSLLLAQSRTIVGIVYIEFSCRGREENTPQLWTAYTTQINMTKAREELIICAVWRTPPACILIVFIQFGRSHYVEWCDTHQTIRHDCPRVGCPEVTRPNEGIDLINQSFRLLGSSCYCSSKSEGERKDHLVRSLHTLT